MHLWEETQQTEYRSSLRHTMRMSSGKFRQQQPRLSLHYLVLLGEFPHFIAIKCFRLCLKPVLRRVFENSNVYFKCNFPTANHSIDLNLNLNTYVYYDQPPRTLYNIRPSPFASFHPFVHFSPVHTGSIILNSHYSVHVTGF